jgi:hypothetical protein
MLRKLEINAGETKGGHGFRLRGVVMRLACWDVRELNWRLLEVSVLSFSFLLHWT